MIKLYGIKLRVNDSPVFSQIFEASVESVEIIKKVLQHNIFKTDGMILWGTGSLLTPENDPNILYGTLSDKEKETINRLINEYLQIDISHINEIVLTTLITENLL